MEFIAAAKAGKLIVYIRSILNNLHISQDNATILYEDNAASIAMANDSFPNRRTWHMEINHLDLLGWVSIDQMILSTSSTNDNPADGITKSLGTQMFAWHSANFLCKCNHLPATFETLYKKVDNYFVYLILLHMLLLHVSLLIFYH